MDLKSRDRQTIAFTQANPLASQLAPKIIFLSLLLIIVSTLYPFKFVGGNASLIATILKNFQRSSSLLDVAANVILFIPLGFGMGSALAKRRFHPVTQAIAILILCAGLSFAIELMQVFLPGRQATPFDVLSNALGGVVGYGIFRWAGSFILRLLTRIFSAIQQFSARFSLWQLILALVGYIAVASAGLFYWQGSSLSGWQDDLPLYLGNDGTTLTNPWGKMVKNPPWEGKLSDLTLHDRALSKAEAERFFTRSNSLTQDDTLLAAYSLKGSLGLIDQSGRSPDLIWQAETPDSLPTTGVNLSKQHWLGTATPFIHANQRIRKTSQFTLSLQLTGSKLLKQEPMLQRILSISQGSSLGNLVLVQFLSDLHIWLYTSNDDRYVRSYRLIVPKFFSDAQPHRVVATYSSFVLRTYVDSTENYYLMDVTPNRYQIILYGLIFPPFAVLIGLLASRFRDRAAYWLLGFAIILPPLLLESFLANEGDRRIRIANLLLGMIFVGGTLVILQPGKGRRAIHHKSA
jgi:VanZ family protein